MTTLALFDLDNTLLSGDSDYEWGQFLVSQKLVDPIKYDAANKKFYDDYKNGVLDIHEFSAFSFEPLTRFSQEELTSLHQKFMQTSILPLIGKKARSLVQQHQEQNHTLLIITATNSFITSPIAKEFGISNLIATEPKVIEGKYTREIDGIPCFQEGKVQRLEHWLTENQLSFEGSYFYSDSHNDLPLLEQVDNPIAVDPDDKLREIAEKNDWKIMSLR